MSRAKSTGKYTQRGKGELGSITREGESKTEDKLKQMERPIGYDGKRGENKNVIVRERKTRGVVDRRMKMRREYD
jgi:hypothetical protein